SWVAQRPSLKFTRMARRLREGTPQAGDFQQQEISGIMVASRSVVSGLSVCGLTQCIVSAILVPAVSITGKAEESDKKRHDALLHASIVAQNTLDSRIHPVGLRVVRRCSWRSKSVRDVPFV